LICLSKDNKSHNHEDPSCHQVPTAIRKLIQENIIKEPELKARDLIKKLNLVQLCPALANVDRTAFIRKQALDSLFGKEKLSYVSIARLFSGLMALVARNYDNHAQIRVICTLPLLLN
jgi:hypothetical protein